MTIATRLNALFLIAVLALGSLAATVSAFRDYQIELDRLTASSSARLLGQPQLQYLIYRQDNERLSEDLGNFLTPEAVSSAIIYTGLGEQLAKRTATGNPSLPPVSFHRVRGSSLTLDTALVSIDASGQSVDQGLWSSLFNQDLPMYYSMPIVTAVNPVERNLDIMDFAQALTTSDSTDSQWVIGYLHLVIDRGPLISAVMPTIFRTMLYILLLAGLCSLVTWYFTRRITRPLKQLAELADEISSGSLEEAVHIEGTHEIKEIARVFNGVIDGLSDAKKEASADKHLLSMKVEERSTQLTQRNMELDRAVEEVTETRNQIHHLSNYDNLTSLPNRQLLTEQLDLLLRLNKRNKHTLALLFIDIDDFKRVNDALGLSAGDQLLQITAARLQEGVRDSDSVGHFISSDNDIDVSRLGDEFTVILNQLDSTESASLVTERLVEKIRQPLEIEGHELIIKPNIGIAIAPADGSSVQDLLRSASSAKVYAKETGSTYEFYNRDMESAGEERIRMESDLRKAIERGELVLHYQPQVDTHSGSVVGAEALLRWEHAELGLIPPGRFIGMAEEIGFMDELGDWVLLQACEQLKALNEEGIKLPKVAINVSAHQFGSAFVQRIGQVITETGIEPTQLELGLTEAMMTSNEHDTIEALRVLKEIGVYLSVDDFGTGYSPISYLSQYPLDELKIDRSFLLESGRSENGAKLVVAIITMAKSLGLKVLASGVESESEFSFLTANGAHIVQGYLFSRPVPAEELKPMLGAWHFMEKVQKLAEAANTSALDRLDQLE